MALPPPTRTNIFISYRRRDAGGHAGRLHEYLSGRFGDDCVFFDRSTIESGDVFPDRLSQAVESCAVLLALIGPEWLDVRGDDGGSRLEDADDFVRQEIALALEQGKKVIPVLFDDTPVPPRDRLPDALKALASCDALTLRGKTYEYQTQRRELVRLLAKVPGVPQPLPEPEADPNRQRMLAEVRRIWIDGYLKDSLHNLVRIELGLEKKPDAVSRPWDVIVQQPDRVPRPLPPGQAMGAIFDELGQALLILGAPGSGKTTLLLELARDLLDRAVQDAKHLIPVVFHLSSWAVLRRPLAKWLVDELTERYYVPRKFAQAWTDAEQVLPLLDGLDEVAPEHRAACVEAINTFRRQHTFVPLAVCSRSAEYDALSVRVQLSGAVLIQPLSRSQISTYLKDAGKPLAGVRTVLRDDETLWSLLETALMLSIVALAYQGRSPAEVRATGSLEQRRTHLFANYVQRMFERRSKITAYTREQTLHWLTWLARSLKHNNLSVFYVERMQPDWLPSPAQRWVVALMSIMVSGLSGGLVSILAYAPVFRLAYVLEEKMVWGPYSEFEYALSRGMDDAWAALIVLAAALVVALVALVVALLGRLLGRLLGLTAYQITIRAIPNERIRHSLLNTSITYLPGGLAAGLVIGLGVGLLFGLRSGLAYGLQFGLLAGLLFGLVGGRDHIAPAETLRWSWGKARSKCRRGLTFGLLFGLGVGLLFMPGAALFFRPQRALTGGLIFGLLFGLLGGLLFGLLGGLTTDQIVTRTIPNEGIRRSLLNALISVLTGGLPVGVFVSLVVGLVVGLIDGLVEGLVCGLIDGLVEGLVCGLIVGLGVGLVSGLFLGLKNGGVAYATHYVLRFLLWCNGYAPLNYVRFLDYAAERVFLRKVGGGYIFTHRLLMEYSHRLRRRLF